MRVNKGNKLSASKWNQLSDAISRLGNLDVAPPLELLDCGTGRSLRLVDNTITARILANSSSSSSSSSSSRSSSSSSRYVCRVIPYAWEEVQHVRGSWQTVSGGRSGSVNANPAYEANGMCVYAGTVVTLYRGLNEEYIFWYCCQAIV
jgi:hypothetical protein